MADFFVPATIRSAGLEVAVGITSQVCRDARKAHGLAASSSVALGRLLTASALLGVTSRHGGTTSLQIITKSRFRQMFADATHQGDVRGFVRNPTLDLPLIGDEERTGRRGLAIAVLPGKLSVVRANDAGQFTQSTTELVSGEVDEDVEHFLEQSDQIPTVLACDVLFGTDEQIEVAGGVLVQALPGGNVARLRSIRDAVRARGFLNLLRAHANDPLALLAELFPDAVPVDAPKSLQWKCRCSRARVLSALKMLSPEDLASMAQENAPTQVGCDMCGASYAIEPSEVAQVFIGTVKAEG